MQDNSPPATGADAQAIRGRPVLNGEDIRTGRSCLRISVGELAELSGVSADMIARIESGLPALTSDLEAIRRVFEARGVFVQFDGTVFFSMTADSPQNIR